MNGVCSNWDCNPWICSQIHYSAMKSDLVSRISIVYISYFSVNSGPAEPRDALPLQTV